MSKLPPLPEPVPAGYIAQTEYFFTKEQMREYGQQCRDAAIAELAKPEGCLSNCDTCTYAWGSPANPGYCVMFYEEPQGVCLKHSEPGQTRNCSRHPDAPHGPDGAGCKCHNWAPGEAS